MAASNGVKSAGKRGNRSRGDKGHDNVKINSRLSKRDLKWETKAKFARCLAQAVDWCEMNHCGAKKCVQHYANLTDPAHKEFNPKSTELPGLPPSMLRTLQRELARRDECPNPMDAGTRRAVKVLGTTTVYTSNIISI